MLAVRTDVKDTKLSNVSRPEDPDNVSTINTDHASLAVISFYYPNPCSDGL